MFCRIAIFSLLSTFFCVSSSGLWAQNIDWQSHPTGLTEPTAEARAWADKNSIQGPIKVKPNTLAMSRITKKFQNKGLALSPSLQMSAVPIGQEISVYDKNEPLKTAAQTFGLPPGSLPDAVDNSTLPFFPPIGDQGQLGSCAAFAVTYYAFTHMTGLVRNWQNNSKVFSPKWTFNLTNGGGKLGSNSIDIMRVLIENGAPDLTRYPYDNDYLGWSTDPQIWNDAINYRAKAFGFLRGISNNPEVFETVKQMLANGYVLNFGTFFARWNIVRVENDTSTPSDDPYVRQSICNYARNYGDTIGHEMTIVGYNDNLWIDINENGLVDIEEKGAFKIANSWGTIYNNNGFVWLAYDALKGCSGVNDAPPSPRELAFIDDEVSWIQARELYQPRMTALVVFNHAKRSQIKLTLGVGNSNSTVPEFTWVPSVLNNNGGPYAFDGTTTAIDGGFTFDLSDLIEKNMVSTAVGKKWYAKLEDNLTSDGAIFKAYGITDHQGNNANVTCPGLPQTADYPSSISVNIPYARAVGTTNYAPLVNAGANKDIFLPYGNTASITGSVLDDNLPAGSQLATTWKKISGPGTVTFSNPGITSTVASVSAPGTYTLGLDAYDGQYQSSSQMNVYAGSLQKTGMINYSSSNLNDIKFAKGYAYVVDGSNVLVIDVSNPSTPVSVGIMHGSYNTSEISITGDYIYVIENRSPANMTIVNISNPTIPILKANISLPNLVPGNNCIAVSNNYAFIAQDTMGVVVVNVTDALNPTIATTLKVGKVTCLTVKDNFLYVGDAKASCLLIFDISNPTTPLPITSFSTSAYPLQVKIVGNYLYELDRSFMGVNIYDIRDMYHPVCVGVISTNARQIAIKGNTLFLMEECKIDVVDITNKAAPFVISSTRLDITNRSFTKMALENNFVYATTVDGFSTYSQNLSNTAPFVFAGNAQIIKISDPLQLAAEVADDAFSPASSLSLVWTQRSGPGTVTFTNPSASNSRALFSEPGQYILRLTASDGSLQTFDDMTITVTANGGLIRQTVSAVKAFSTESTSTPASAAIDGDIATCWSSAHSDPQWIMFDMGGAKSIGAVVFDWATANARDYLLEGSNDSSFATKVTLKALTTMGTGNHRIDSLYSFTNPGLYRYYRMYGTQRNTTSGYSIWECRFYLNEPYTIAASAGSHGSISPSGNTTVNPAANQTFTMTPANGYTVDYIVIDNMRQSASSSYTFNNVSGNHSIQAAFTIAPVVITATASGHGSISPAGTVSVQPGTAVNFTIKPANGYAIDSIIVDGKNSWITTSYPFPGSTLGGLHTIHVIFVQAYTLTSSSVPTEGGYVLGGGIHYSGTKFELMANPASGYVFSGWSGDLSGTLNPDSLLMNGNKTVTARFTQLMGPIALQPVSAVRALSTESDLTSAANAIDKNISTRWSSTFSDPQWIKFDMGSAKNITSVVFDWETANARNYTFEASNDSSFATSVILKSPTNMNADVHRIDSLFAFSNPGSYRYYRMYGTTRNTTYGYSLWETRFYGNVITPTCNIIARTFGSGSISPSGLITVNQGASQSFIITPSSGYVVDYVTNGREGLGQITSYTFSNIMTDQGIQAYFKLAPDNYTLSMLAANGKISLSPPGGSYAEGTVVTMTAIPDSGFAFANWTGEVTGTDNPVTITMDGNKIGAANFVNAPTYTVNATAGANGGITPSGTVITNVGVARTFTIIQNTGFTVDQVLVDGENMGSVTSYIFTTSTTGVHTISATFKPEVAKYTLTTTANPSSGGMISGNNGSYISGTTATITANPSSEYQFTGWSGDAAGANSQISLIMNADKRVTANFMLIPTYSVTATAGANGTISPTGTIITYVGIPRTFTIKPNNGYSVDRLLVDNVTIGVVPEYTFPATTTGSHTIAVTYKVSPNYIPIPGLIQAENYNSGGENIGYHDNTPGNSGGAYKPNDNVDIENCSDIANGYDIGWTDAGEWLAYDVTVQIAGTYKLTARMASGASGTKTMTMSVDGATVGTFSFSDASGWQNWRDVTSPNINLTAGYHVVRFNMSTSGINLNYVDVASVSTNPGALQFSAATCSVNESGPTVTITVNRANGSDGSVSVNYATSNGTATGGSDYTAVNGTLTFAAGVTTQTFTVAITNDVAVESNETVNLTLSNPTGGATLGTPVSAVLTIVDDEQSGITLPGRFQAEEYKIGGEGIGYHDLTTGNTGGAYNRNDNVDIESCSEGGYDVGWIDNGEWLAYDVNVAQTGNYKMTVRGASGQSITKTLTITIDGNPLTTISTTVNNGWQGWTDVSSGNFNLTAGAHVIRVTMSGSLNLNYFDVSASTTTNLITNGEFSNGGTGWTTGGTSFGTVSFSAGNADWTINSGSGQAWEPQMMQSISLIVGRQYTLCFDIRTDESARSISVGVNGDANDNYADRGLNQPVNVTTSWVTQSFTFTANATDASSRLDFNMGANANDVIIDNVRLVEGATCN